ncbi:hypothetical protein GGQ96_001377 [Sphingomonas abaci]|uniref:Uncharacterized protein n=1 Tax=Sphingomonas abaci TaxID=237611 RepID=A0A7W7AHS9_9SPHN|nr:hypothetical protein [Sphingomonas abaci]
MSSADELMNEIRVATRVAGMTADPGTARQIRSYVVELEDRLRRCMATAPKRPL